MLQDVLPSQAVANCLPPHTRPSHARSSNEGGSDRKGGAGAAAQAREVEGIAAAFAGMLVVWVGVYVCMCLGVCCSCVQGWPEPYVCTVYCVFCREITK